jgi:hypothetical protein
LSRAIILLNNSTTYFDGLALENLKKKKQALSLKSSEPE